MNALDTWFGTLPREWRSSPIKADFAIQLGKMLQPSSRGGGDRQTSYLRAANVQWDGVRLGKDFLKSMYASRSDLVQYAAATGDVLVVEGGEGGRTCLMVEAVDDLIIQNSLLRLRPKDLNVMRSRFLVKVMRAANAAGYFAAANNGSTISHFTKVKCAVMPVPTPPDDLMNLIVRYLDHAELRIAKAIAAKSELAKLLQQQRLALLCSEVLGRDEDTDISRDFGQLVESRVLDWVGPVPKAWDVVPMSGVFDVVKQKNIGLIENTVLSLSYGRVVIKPAEKLRGLVPESFETYQIIEPGDVIVRPTDLQNDTTSLRIGQARDHGIITSAYIALRPKTHVDPDYVMMQLAAYDFLKVLYGFGSGLRQNLDFKHLKHVPMMLPSLAEQSAIVSRVRAKTESVEQAHAVILQEIALLKEYRIRLISDVVTGKLDVRDEAVKLPEIDPMELSTVAVGENGDEEEATDDD